ncbi:ABC transporter substrate-binding protein [Ruminococcaceae bacterium OttesenSCG-928-L11]|nr:ABC transporter substrate-binding protein [Ruminococcaceae bacterium OttesenSCG-928-L11]
MTSKRFIRVLLTGLLMVSLLAGCQTGSNTAASSGESTPQSSQSTTEASLAPESDETGETEDVVDEPIEVPGSSDGVEIRVGALKGPTGMAMASLMAADEHGDSSQKYEFTIVDAPDQIAPLLTNGELDIAAMPVNMASILYNKTGGEIQMLAVNTLGVIYVLTNDETISSVEDLRGKTIYATGQGASPEYVLNHVLRENGIDPEADVEIEYKSEHSELATLLGAGEVSIAVLPEPFVTTVTMQNPQIQIALDLTKEWETVSDGAVQTTGCIVARKGFIESRKQELDQFLTEYAASAEFAVSNVDEAADIMAQFEIIPKAAVAKQAIPRCNIVYLDGADMKKAAGTYLDVLLQANPQSIGGALPNDDFYYEK